MRRRRLLVVFVLAVGMGGVALWACGGGDDDRTTKMCRACDDHVDLKCFSECQELCSPGEADCQIRCAAQCDECRRDLVCSVCRDGCTGTVHRCAPENETVQCADGVFGTALETATP